MEPNKKGEVEDVVGTRLNITQFAKRSLESRLAATEKALRSEKVLYTSKCDTGVQTHNLEK